MASAPKNPAAVELELSMKTPSDRLRSGSVGTSKPPHGLLLLLPFLFLPFVAPLRLRSGEFVPLDAPSGFLACPQSLTTREGLGFCVAATPLGASSADVFVQCAAQLLEPNYGSSLMYRFPLMSIDHGVPTFGAPITLPQDGVLPGNASLASLATKTIVQTDDDTVLLAAFSSDLMHIVELTDNGTRWKHVSTSNPFALPTEWGGNHLSSAAVVLGDKHGDSLDGWRVYVSFTTCNSTRARSEWSGRGRNSRDEDYYPYTGEGIWRGSLSQMGVGTFFIGPDGVAKSSSFRRITDPNWTGGLMSLELAVMRNGNVNKLLVGATRTGLVYAFDTENLAQTKQMKLQSAFSEPTPLVDSDTGLLFEARVIGAKPIAFPMTGSKLDSLIIGGENGLFFVPTRHLTHRFGSHSSMQLPSVRDGGPVMEAGATLVTGQTPTVSVADFDMDGLQDIIAGTSEGRIMLARQSSEGGFMRPIPLRVGHGDDSEELLVQGGYRTDLQGPSESRWGYTAPCAVDWNGDGLVDLVSSDNSALTRVYLRFRAVDGSLGLRRGRNLKLDGLPLHGTWRNGPAAALVSFDASAGHMYSASAKVTGSATSTRSLMMALVTSDEQDEAHLYWRVDNLNLRDGGKLRYRVPNCSSSNGSSDCVRSIQTNYLHAGGSGRLKYSLVDWDRDGLIDLLLGTCGYHSVPSNTTGLPAFASHEGAPSHNNGATVLVMRQIGQEGSQADGPIFEWPEWITVRGTRISYGGQEIGVAPFDAGDGMTSLIVATPGGRHVYWAARDLGTSQVEPPVSESHREDVDAEHTIVFTNDEIKQCTRMRSPNLVYNQKTGSIHMAVRCCGKNRCSNPHVKGEEQNQQNVRDNLKDCKVGLKSSRDGGRTWTDWQIVSGPNPGYGHGSPLYDSHRNRIVLQYQSFLSSGGTTKPTPNTSYFQIVSDDDAKTWTSPPRNITHFFQRAQRSQHDMMDITAGNKVQTASGRLLWLAHDHSSTVVSWFSDDGGDTFNVSSNKVQGNEVSVAVQIPGTKRLIMDGRGQSFPWFPHRAVYYSIDDGTTWSEPKESPLMDPPDAGCQRALISRDGILYTSEPQLAERHRMVLQCSQDGGKTYPWSTVVGGNNARGGYSDLSFTADGMLLMVWEDYNSNNVFAQRLSTDWCGGAVTSDKN